MFTRGATPSYSPALSSPEYPRQVFYTSTGRTRSAPMDPTLLSLKPTRFPPALHAIFADTVQVSYLALRPMSIPRDVDPARGHCSSFVWASTQSMTSHRLHRHPRGNIGPPYLFPFHPVGSFNYPLCLLGVGLRQAHNRHSTLCVQSRMLRCPQCATAAHLKHRVKPCQCAAASSPDAPKRFTLLASHAWCS